jgi:FkbM family methyltransferase
MIETIARWIAAVPANISRPIFKAMRALPLANKIKKHLNFRGPFRVRIENTPVTFRIWHYGWGYVVENDLFWNGLPGKWEQGALRVWMQLCRLPDTKTIFDIGANTGIYSLIAQALNPQAQVHAFEPVPSIFQQLQTNVKLNHFPIQCHSIAASDVTGEGTIFLTPDLHAYSITLNKNLYDSTVKVQPRRIATYRLDEWIDKLHISPPDILKIDVETHEPEVLRGLGNYLHKQQPLMIVEVLNPEIGKQVRELLTGFEIYNIRERDTLLTLTDAPGIFKAPDYNYLVGTPDKIAPLRQLFRFAE